MHRPVITVIVPVYNTERFLDQAIRSLQEQTFSDWALLLIDDGSTDSSGRICDRYAEEDSRIRVFHTENKGYASARNLGLLNTESDWVMFLDSDDRLAPFALQHMLDSAGQADLVMGLHQTFPYETMAEEGVISGCFKVPGDIEDVFTDVYYPYFFLSVTAKLYRRSILKSGFDTEHGLLICDWLYNFQLLPSCREVCFLPEIVYYYRYGDHVSTTSYFHIEWLYVSKRVYEAVLGLFPANSSIEAYMSRRYANRVGQYLLFLASLQQASEFQKLAMVEAERSEPFYQLPAISRSSCNERYTEMWKAFLAGNSKAALDAAVKSLQKSSEA